MSTDRLSTCLSPSNVGVSTWMSGSPSTGRKWIRGPATSVRRDDSTSSAGGALEVPAEPADELPAFIGLPGHDHGIDVLDDGRSSDAVACRQDGDPLLAHGEHRRLGVIDRRTDDPVHGAGLRGDLRDHVRDVVRAADDDRTSQVVAECPLVQQPLAPQPALEH